MATIRLTTPIPGPKSQAVVARREAAMAQGNAKLTGISAVKAEGATVTDIDGNVLLDFAGGIGTLAAGHCPPQVVEAIQAQAADLIHLCSIVGSYEPLVALCEKLNEITPGSHRKKTTLSNSGAEAVEAAVKMSRAYTGREAI